MHDGTHYCNKMFFIIHFICIIVYMYYLRFCYFVVLKLQLFNGNTITIAVYQEPPSKRKLTEEESLSEVSDTTSYLITSTKLIQKVSWVCCCLHCYKYIDTKSNKHIIFFPGERAQGGLSIRACNSNVQLGTKNRTPVTSMLGNINKMASDF